MRLLTIAAVFWFLADQLSKIAVLHWAGLLERGVIEVFPPFLMFILGYNTGINFGLFASGPEVTRWILVGIALAISAWLWWWARTGLTRPIALISAGVGHRRGTRQRAGPRIGGGRSGFSEHVVLRDLEPLCLQPRRCGHRGRRHRSADLCRCTEEHIVTKRA
jgi:hypothetical protein